MTGKPLPILEYPDPRLKKRSLPVARIDDPLRQLMDDMLATIYATRSIGLAAPQVGVPLRLIVIDVSDEQNDPRVLINPTLLSSDIPGMAEEQCLSLPGISDKVKRALRVRVAGQDRDGAQVELLAEGLLAVCIQHEIDHLDGKLFIDSLSWLKRARIRRRLLLRRAAAGVLAG